MLQQNKVLRKIKIKKKIFWNYRVLTSFSKGRMFCITKLLNCKKRENKLLLFLHHEMISNRILKIPSLVARTIDLCDSQSLAMARRLNILRRTKLVSKELQSEENKT